MEERGDEISGGSFFGLNLLDNSEKPHRVKGRAPDKEPEDQADPRSAVLWGWLLQLCIVVSLAKKMEKQYFPELPQYNFTQMWKCFMNYEILCRIPEI